MEPFLKWAGGKRWLISKTDNLLPNMANINRYFEPFLGGGSMYFHLQPTAAYLSDINSDLINAYSVIRDNWKELYTLLRKYHREHSSTFYYQIRSSKPKISITKAARFIYLNRTCWNGLYRVNLKGAFNVPIGTKTNVILDDDNFEQLSLVLNSTHIEVCDFEVKIDQTIKGDFVFIDPPYTVKHNLNGFIKYNEKMFSWEDQIRLKNAIARASKRGVYILVLNANHKSIKELYKEMGAIITLERASVIAGNSLARGIISELAIKCW